MSPVRTRCPAPKTPGNTRVAVPPMAAEITEQPLEVTGEWCEKWCEDQAGLRRPRRTTHLRSDLGRLRGKAVLLVPGGEAGRLIPGLRRSATPLHAEDHGCPVLVRHREELAEH